ncbi:MAG TPA: sensor domain-containing diguanylate cyclase [Thermoanaerobaculia bacterium]|nr:sensor domain-containing diguanylate cyclase [Thermoanaerobaculia bacterium]
MGILGDTARRWLGRGTRRPLGVQTPPETLAPAAPVEGVAPPGRRTRLALGIVALGLLLSVTTFLLASRGYSAAERSRLAREADALVASLGETFSRSGAQLYGLRGLYESSDEVRGEEFRRFAQRILERHPEIRGLSWNPRLPAASAEERARQLEALGLAGLEPWQRGPDGSRQPVPSGRAAVVVGRIEPFAPNRAALGFDIASEPTRNTALELSLKTGRPTQTAPIQLVQQARPDDIGILTLLPVFAIGSDGHPGAAPPLGWVAQVSEPQVIADALADERWRRHGWAFTLWDREATERTLLAHWGGAPMLPESPRTLIADLSIGERAIVAVLRPLAPPRRAHEPWGMAASVLAFTLLLGFVVWRLDRQRSYAEWLSRTDPLTGLANRRELGVALESAFAGGASVTLILVDIDHFKAVNDSFGHAAGDRVLQLVAGALQETVRGATDRVGRMGGEEFAVLLCGLEEEEIAPVWLRLQERIRALGARLPCPVTVSAGIASTSLEAPGTPLRSGVLSPTDRAELLLRKADDALYTAKHRGRDGAVLQRGDTHEPLEMR